MNTMGREIQKSFLTEYFYIGYKKGADNINMCKYLNVKTINYPPIPVTARSKA
jgi:hypothetical protein